MAVSTRLKVAIKLNEEPAYRIAQKAGIDPSTLSKLIHGFYQIKPNDPRIISVGRILGIPPEECFER
jgi:hypothetical protein